MDGKRRQPRPLFGLLLAAATALPALAGSQYLQVNGSPAALVGVSADNACHFETTGTGQCNFGNYKSVIDDLAAPPGQRRIRGRVTSGGYREQALAVCLGAAKGTYTCVGSTRNPPSTPPATSTLCGPIRFPGPAVRTARPEGRARCRWSPRRRMISTSPS